LWEPQNYKNKLIFWMLINYRSFFLLIALMSTKIAA
jgi:hypothetical protein